MVKKKKQINYFWLYYLLFLIPLTFDLYIIILELNEKENKNMTEGIISASVTVIVAIIGLILAALKLASKKDTKELEVISSETNNILGGKRDITLQGQVDIIKNKISKNLESTESSIIKNLNKVSEYIDNESFMKKHLGDERDYLKLIEMERTRDKIQLSKLEQEKYELISLNNVLDKKVKNLENDKVKLQEKIKNLESNRDKDFER